MNLLERTLHMMEKRAYLRLVIPQTKRMDTIAEELDEIDIPLPIRSMRDIPCCMPEKALFSQTERKSLLFQQLQKKRYPDMHVADPPDPYHVDTLAAKQLAISQNLHPVRDEAFYAINPSAALLSEIKTTFTV